MGFLKDALAPLKSVLPFPSYGGGGGSWFGSTSTWNLPGHLTDEQDYTSLVGDGSQSSLVGACISWIANAFIQTEPTVVRYASPTDRYGEPQRTHPMATILRYPTRDPVTLQSPYGFSQLVQALLTSFLVNGNAYLLKRRDGYHDVIQLFYVPHYMVEPRWDNLGKDFISYYDYTPSGSPIPIDPSEIIHFRDGLDSQNVRKGLSKMNLLLREIYTDEEAARWTASLLQNQGIPGMVISPGAGAGTPSQTDVADIKSRFMADFTAGHRGEPLVFSGPTTVTQYGYSPQQMELSSIRDVPEERITAALGVPAPVVGFQMQNSKVGATMAELVDLAWQNGVIPRLLNFQRTLNEQLGPDFGLGENDAFEFDTSRVPIMADYHAKRATEQASLYRFGLTMRSDGRRALGLKVTPEDDVYAIPSGQSLVDDQGEIVAGQDVGVPGEPTALAPGDTTPALPATVPKGLTARETEIAGLVAKGLSNKGIAEKLVIGERTVETHVANVMAKQGVRARTKVAT